MTMRVLPPIGTAQQSIAVHGRNHSATPGSTLDVPDGDALVLGANGWIVIAPSGGTYERPTKNADGTLPVHTGTRFLDTSLAQLIVWDGATWRDPGTGDPV